jgi:hypothetical protein
MDMAKPRIDIGIKASPRLIQRAEGGGKTGALGQAAKPIGAGALGNVGTPPSSGAELSTDKAKRDAPQDAKDTMSEMGEDSQRRMQDDMGRRSKMQEALSNAMKKSSESQGAITGNMK